MDGMDDVDPEGDPSSSSSSSQPDLYRLFTVADVCVNTFDITGISERVSVLFFPADDGIGFELSENDGG